MRDKLFAAIDCGAGNIKIRFGGKRRPKTISMPSLLCQVSKESVLRGDASVVDSAAFSFDGEFYYVGQAVSDRNLPSEDVHADPKLKVRNAKKLILAAIVQGLGLKNGACFDIGVVVSHHDPNSMGAELRAELEGIHTFSKGNSDYEIALKLPKHGVFMEGSALSAIMDDEVCDLFGVLDLGFLTSLYSLRDNEGEVIGDATPQANGVGNLITRLQKEVEFKKLLGGIEPNRDVIISSLLEAARSNSSKLYYRAGGQAIEFSSVYKKVIPLWLKSAAQKAVSALGERKGTGFKVIAIGGGCNLPRVAATLSKAGIEVYKDDERDPIFANVESLYLKHVVSARRDDAFIDFVGVEALENGSEPVNCA